MGQYIDFAYVKAHADFAAVLEYYHIEAQGSGSERRCRCPFHDDEKPSLTVNLEKKVYNCHAASCGESGNILDFVAAIEECDLRAAAAQLAEVCGIAVANPNAGRSANGKSKKQGRTKKPKAPSKTPKDERADPVNPPLTFSLKLDPKHEYGSTRGLSPAVISQLEMGYASRGSMSGRWCAPLHNAAGELVAYIGRYAADPVPDDVEKYRLPKGFHKELVLYNLHRVAGHTEIVALVEGIFDVARLHALAMPVVGLLGTSVSDAQIALLKAAGITQVISLLDAGSEKAERKLVHRLSGDFFVRRAVLPDGEDPATVSEAVLREQVPVLVA